MSKSFLSKRVGGLFKVAAMPSVVVGFLGDFFSPMGGALIPMAIFIICCIFVALLVFRFKVGSEEFKSTWIYQVFASDQELGWVWEGNHPIKVHGLQVVVLIGFISAFIGVKSHASSAEGGLLAKNSGHVRQLQELLAVSKQQTEVLKAIEVNTAGGKREVSQDPIKELNNMGVPYSIAGIREAMQIKNHRAINLFADARISIPEGYRGGLVVSAIFSGDRHVVHAISRIGDLADLNENGCADVYFSLLAGKPSTQGASIMSTGVQGIPEEEKREIIRSISSIDGFSNFVNSRCPSLKQKIEEHFSLLRSLPIKPSEYEDVSKTIELIYGVL